MLTPSLSIFFKRKRVIDFMNGLFIKTTNTMFQRNLKVKISLFDECSASNSNEINLVLGDEAVTKLNLTFGK